MVYSGFSSFSEKASSLIRSATDAIDWFQQNPKAAKGNIAVPQAALRRYRRIAQKLTHSAQQPPLVAVFGASQAGKSYLVTGLASQNGKTLTAHYAEKDLDFLTEINPPGGNESTALVTRFTTQHLLPPHSSASIPLRLLSYRDIVNILMNAYLEDFTKATPLPSAESIEALFLSAPRTPTPLPFFDLDDIEALQDQVQSAYVDNPRLSWATETYWARLKQSLPELTAEGAAQVLSPLWGTFKPLTLLATNLFTARLALGENDLVFCSIKALSPREKSILHVETLYDLNNESNNALTDILEVVSHNGQQTMRIPRTFLAALGSEITVPLKEKAWPFLEDSDLLDFPGARSRENISDPEGFFAHPSNLGRIFLRGKIAHLFNMYQTSREISAMILCVSDSVQNVTTLPPMVDSWVSSMIGATPQIRAEKPETLFVVLTKFDREFEEKKGESSASLNRWTTRLNASLIDFFKASPWFKEWRPGQPFNNTYWLRSTAVAFPAVFAYEDGPDGRREKDFTPDGAHLVAERYKGYIANPEVQIYIRSAERAWNEVLKANNGGVSYLTEQLANANLFNAKSQQLNVMLKTLALEMARYLQHYYRSDNQDETIQKARLEAQEVARSLMASLSSQMLAPLMHRLQISRTQLMDIWHLMESNVIDHTAPIGRISNVDAFFSDMFPESSENTADSTAQPPPPIEDSSPSFFQPADRHDQFADMVITKWNSLIDTFAQEEDLETVYHVPAHQISILVTELGILANRVNMRQTLADRFRKQASYQSSLNLSGEIQSLIAEIEIGNFITWLGYHRVPVTERPHSLGKNPHPIFLPRAPVNGLPPLKENPTPYNEQYVRDWISAMVERFAENAGAVGLNGVDPAANMALKSIIDAIGHCLP